MKATQLLHKNLSNACPDIHNVRMSALLAAVNSAITKQQVTVTMGGRTLTIYEECFEEKNSITPTFTINF